MVSYAMPYLSRSSAQVLRIAHSSPCSVIASTTARRIVDRCPADSWSASASGDTPTEPHRSRARPRLRGFVAHTEVVARTRRLAVALFVRG